MGERGRRFRAGRLAVGTALVGSLAIGSSAAATGSFATHPYLMAVLACRVAQCPNPATHQVFVLQSRDGLHWSRVPSWRPFPGSVPDLVRRGPIVYIYALSPGGPSGLTLIRVNELTGATTAPFGVTIAGLRGSFVDPSVALDASGRLILAGLVARGVGYDPAACPPPATSCTQSFDSATEIPGTNGTRFRLDPGTRATVALSPAQPVASDPSLFAAGGQWAMEISLGASVVAGTSSTPRGTFRYVGSPSEGAGGVPSGYYDAVTHQYWTSITAGAPNQPTVIRRAVSPSLTTTIPSDQWITVVTSTTLGLGPGWSVQSPGFAPNVPRGPSP